MSYNMFEDYQALAKREQTVTDDIHYVYAVVLYGRVESLHSTRAKAWQTLRLDLEPEWIEGHAHVEPFPIDEED